MIKMEIHFKKREKKGETKKRGTATFSLLVNPKTDYGLRRCCFAQQLWFRGYKQQAVVVCFTPLIFGELKSVELEDERVV
jgi:hypothetical protein